MNKNARVTGFTHGDADGVGCATLAKKAFGARIDDIHFVNYNDVDVRVTEFVCCNRDRPQILLVTDICPKREIIDQITAEVDDGAFEALIIDHHKTTAWMDDYELPWIIHDQSMCGTKLFHQWLIDNVDANLKTAEWRRFADLIDVYDRWILDSPLRPEAEKLNRLVWFLGFERFIGEFVKHPMADGDPKFHYIDKCLLDKEERTITSVLAEQLEDENRFMDRDKRKFLLMITSNHASQIGNAALEDDEDIEYVVILNPLHDKFELRARKGGVDVSEIAKRYGGGGHQAASGFQFPFKKFLRAMFENWF